VDRIRVIAGLVAKTPLERSIKFVVGEPDR
ncbi:MAG: hypothetical protein JWP08_1238, partial [Bryobacterales bacterium]|nr:hypothetical protein [Bryobacterales bacterium]